MVAFAREVRRLAPSYFVQTPNFWFPMEPHWMVPAFHWLPAPVRVQMFMRFDLGHARRTDTVGAACPARRTCPPARPADVQVPLSGCAAHHGARPRMSKSLVAVRPGGV
jgi:hypothetical protein